MPDEHGDLLAALRALGDHIDDHGASTDPVAAAVRHIRAAAAPVPASPSRRPRSRFAGRATPGRPLAGGRLAAPGVPRVGRHLGRRPVLVAAAALLVLAGVVAVPGPRGAVARLLGIGGVRLELSGELPAGAPGTQGLGEPIDVDAAVERAPAPLAPDGLGPPSAAFAGLPAGGVSLVWAARDGLPPLDPAEPGGAGLVVTAFPTGAGGRLQKPVSNVEAVTVGEAEGLWVSGPPHDVSVLGPDGRPVPDTLRLARNTLLWEAGGVTYRLESALGRDEAVSLAESID